MYSNVPVEALNNKDAPDDDHKSSPFGFKKLTE